MSHRNSFNFRTKKGSCTKNMSNVVNEYTPYTRTIITVPIKRIMASIREAKYSWG